MVALPNSAMAAATSRSCHRTLARFVQPPFRSAPLGGVWAQGRVRRASTGSEESGSASEPQPGAVDAAASDAAAAAAGAPRVLFESDVQITPLIETAKWRCRTAAGFASVGFSAVIGSLATTAPPAVVGLLVGGVFVNSYMFHSANQRILRGFAMRHVERVTLLGEADAGGLAIEVRSANVTRRLELVDPAGPWEGSRFLGLVADTRVSFADICGSRSILHVDVAAGKADDPELLQSILSTSKVIASEAAEVREDVDESLRPPAPELDMSSLRTVPVEPPAGAPKQGLPSPVEMVEHMGKRTLGGGALILLAGATFASGRRKRQMESGSTAPKPGSLASMMGLGGSAEAPGQPTGGGGGQGS